MLEVGVNYIELSQEGKQMINVTPKQKQIEYKETKRDKAIHKQFMALRFQLERLFLKEIKDYLYVQRSKVLEKLNQMKSFDKLEYAAILSQIDIWENENARMELKFFPIYSTIMEESAKVADEIIDWNRPYTVDESIIRRRLRNLTSINYTTSRQIATQVRQGLEKGESISMIADRVRGTYNKYNKKKPEMSMSRSETIARTETGSVMNQTAFGEYQKAGIQKKKWLPGSRDSHVACGAQGAIPMNDTFQNGLMYPGDAGPAEEVVNCTCAISIDTSSL
jgi:hypothetical protein